MRLIALTVFAGLLVTAAALSPAQAWSYKLLYNFTGGNDGSDPQGLLRDEATGDLYGVALGGGNTGCHPGGCGVIFKLAPNGSETVLYTLTDERNGTNPAELIRDGSGNLYGATLGGGHFPCGDMRHYGCGVIFKLSADGTYTLLHVFHGADGDIPDGLTQDAVTGDLYGTTQRGGANDLGAVFRLGLDGKYKLLHSFNGSDGDSPVGSLLREQDGVLYGATATGGVDCGEGQEGCGTIFKIAPDGSETVLYAFTSGRYGFPSSGLAEDKAGNFYGTGSGFRGHHGAIYELKPNGRLKTLHKFADDGKGSVPFGNLIRTSSGALIGATPEDNQVYRLTPHGNYQILYRFNDVTEGSFPKALIEDDAGNLYGALVRDPENGAGAIFELVK
jgi:uncharacterized repeat protein (TIGR03803 family)